MNQSMKDVKFTMLTKDLINYLGGRPNIIVADGAGKSKNSLIESVVLEAVSDDSFNSNFETMFEPSSSVWREDIVKHRENLTSLSNLLKEGKHAWSNVFWNLFLLAIDDNIYNEEAENVADLAAIYHFTPEMMEDWCNAVNYVLSGKRLSKYCDFICKTESGKKFFLHQKNSQKTPPDFQTNLKSFFIK